MDKEIILSCLEQLKFTSHALKEMLAEEFGEDKMICVFCKGSLTQKKVREEIKVGNDHVLVDLDAEECDNCHERYFPSGTVDYLQRLKEELKTKRSSFKVVGQVYQNAS